MTKTRAVTVSFTVTGINAAGAGTAAPISVTWN
jgi:hypothetical protein